MGKPSKDEAAKVFQRMDYLADNLKLFVKGFSLHDVVLALGTVCDELADEEDNPGIAECWQKASQIVFSITSKLPLV